MTATTIRGRQRLAGLAGLLGTAVVLVAGKSATAPAAPPVELGTPQTSDPIAPAGPGGSTTKAPGSATADPGASGGSGTVLGRPEDIGYGIVQVRLTLTNGRITDVENVRMPSGGRSSRIAAYAAPRLRSEVLAAQSADIDTVSGASYTSEGYAASVQSALDAVRLDAAPLNTAPR